ncbi:hypothetical protein DSO57_1026200 [Entomophthora muscae]|uniref:Uncharacterized protein n=1 Tax=Entomophthora muscae TaxID=34485 RepID=A0ACC2SF28_9FUNG|nr:hypothetical protein DSO57_1026200 [Entomophthora muscae]
MSLLAESFTPYSKNRTSSFFTGPITKTPTEQAPTTENSTLFTSLGLDIVEDEFSINDVQSKAEENDKTALDAALKRIKVLEEDLRNVKAEKTTYADNLKESTEFRADLESSFNKLQVEFDQYKATVTAPLIAKNEALQLDMERLAEKLMDEAERRSELEHAKQALEAEIEDLSQKLFEEANKMVSDERKINRELELKYENLQAKFNDLKVLLESEKEQSVELKVRLGSLIEEKDLASGESDPPGSSNSNRRTRSHSVSTISAPRSIYSSDSDVQLALRSTDIYTSGNSALSFHNNDHRFQEFKEFLEAPTNKGLYLSSKFMKRTLNEDVDPALRFDSGPISGWMTQKRLLSAAQAGNINIFPLKSDGGVSPAHIKSCVFCVAKKECSLFYQYTIIGTDSEPNVICYQCRDRLLAVCKFFALLRMARAGVVKDSPQKLYLSCLHAKHSMFLSRVGANLAFCEESVESPSEADPSSGLASPQANNVLESP